MLQTKLSLLSIPNVEDPIPNVVVIFLVVRFLGLMKSRDRFSALIRKTLESLSLTLLAM